MSAHGMSPEGLIVNYLMRNTDRPVSLTELSKALKLPPQLIFMKLKELMRRGFILEGDERVGYQLICEDDLRLAGIYLQDISTKYHFDICFLEKVTSTQDIAKELMREQEIHSILVIAEEQSRGRGRLDRRWISTPGGIWMTFALHIRLQGVKIPILGMTGAVSVAKAIENITSLNAKVKWPNDVLVNGRKVCGILIEASLSDAEALICMGIGLNVNNDIPKDLVPSATSLKAILKKPVPRLWLLRAILLQLCPRIPIVIEDPSNILDEWRKLSSTLRKRVKVVLHERTITGKAVDIADDGSLILLTSEGLKKIAVGDIVHLRDT